VHSAKAQARTDGTAVSTRESAWHNPQTRKRTVVVGDDSHAVPSRLEAMQRGVGFVTLLSWSPAATRLSKEQQLVEIDAIARVHVGAAEAAQNVLRRESLTRLSRHQLDERSEFSV